MRVTNDSMAVLGGSGYMKDYPVERHLRDSRITTIYEGTTQLQVLAAVAGVVSGTAGTIIEELLARPSGASASGGWPEDVEALVEQVRSGAALMEEAIQFVKSQAGASYRDLYARKLVDMAIYLIVGALFCDHAVASEKKKAVAKRWLADKLPQIRMFAEQICSGDESIVKDFEALAGPVPVAE